MSTNPTFGFEQSQFHTDIYDASSATTPITTITTIPYESTNATIGSQITSFAKQFAVQALAGYSGFPQVVSIDTNKETGGAYISKYAALPLDKLSSGYTDYSVGFQHTDFRAKIAYTNKLAPRFDGTSAGIRKSYVAIGYAVASASPWGAYSVFNINGNKNFGAGIGDHSSPGAITSDFTMRSHVATRWDPTKPPIRIGTAKGSWQHTRYPNELITPFRGDRVTVIDFGRRTLDNAYSWNPVLGDTPEAGILGAINAGLTQDFIKFFFTGPSLFNGNVEKSKDDIMVFRAIINTLTDSFQANWNQIQMIGRADPNYQYTGFSRDLNLDFTIIATSRDELKPIWRKLNALAGYTAPEYDNSTIALKAPWMRITIGDLFVQQPAFLTGLTYTLQDSDTSWEINIEQDPTMMQVPHKISVSCQLTIVSDYLPQKNGRFYTLAKTFNSTGSAVTGDNNWLSDSYTNEDILAYKIEQDKNKLIKPGKATGKQPAATTTTGASTVSIDNGGNDDPLAPLAG